MTYNEDKIKESIVAALEDMEMPHELVSDATFHMTDWLSDLSKWHSFCEDPESLSSEELQNLLIRFLIHVPNHVAAASKLINDIPVKDVFNVGSTTESDD